MNKKLKLDLEPIQAALKIWSDQVDLFTDEIQEPNINPFSAREGAVAGMLQGVTSGIAHSVEDLRSILAQMQEAQEQSGND